MSRTLLPLFICLFLPSLRLAAESNEAPGHLPAFPGAEGYGARTAGGRGGRVIKVTNLKAQGPGSLQAACSAEGPRIVVFDVSGVIPGNIIIEHGAVSIFGQTAPGAGITIAGMLASRYGSRHPIDDIIIRFIRVRPTTAKGAGGDAVQFSQNRRVILDHVSCAWAVDETIDIYGANDVTIQWCTIEESLVTGHPKGRHNYGLISGPQGQRVSIHHTLFAHHSRRCPAIANGPADVRNNVVYNFRDGFGHENRPNDGGYNLIGNYYKRGPSDPKIFPFCFQGTVAYYLRDNYIEGVGLVQNPWKEADKLPGLQYYAAKGRPAKLECAVPEVTTHTPEEAYRLVLDCAGCFPRDVVTTRIVEETRRGTGKWGRQGTPDLMEGLDIPPAPTDTDGDGMPDAWEKKNRLNPRIGSDHSHRMASGYTAIEEYADSCAAQRMSTQPMASQVEVRKPDGPHRVIFYDGFEYKVKREGRNERPAFITQGGWSGIKSQNSRGKGYGYLYTVDRIPGYGGPFPGRNSKRVLAIEARSKTFNGQTDFYLQYGNARGPADQIPGDVWFQFWLYVNDHDDPEDKKDQLSGFGGGKFIYPSVDGHYPTHPVWLFCVGNSSKEPFWATAPSHDLYVVTPCIGAENKTAAQWNRWKLGQTSLDARIVANRWTLVKIHYDTSTASGRYEVWMKPLKGKWVKVTEWIDGVTKDFSWKIPKEKVGGYRVFRMPTTHGGFGERAKNNKDSWIYMDDFAMASSEDALPKYPE